MQKLLFAKILATIPSKAKKCLSIFQKVQKELSTKSGSPKVYISIIRMRKNSHTKCLSISQKL